MISVPFPIDRRWLYWCTRGVQAQIPWHALLGNADGVTYFTCDYGTSLLYRISRLATYGTNVPNALTSRTHNVWSIPEYFQLLRWHAACESTPSYTKKASDRWFVIGLLNWLAQVECDPERRLAVKATQQEERRWARYPIHTCVRVPLCQYPAVLTIVSG